MFDEMRIDDPGLDTGALQMGIETFPVDAGAFHDDQFDIRLEKPARQGTAIALETAEFAALLFDGAIRLFNDERDHVQHLMGHRCRPRVGKAETVLPCHPPLAKIKVVHRASMNWKTPQTQSVWVSLPFVLRRQTAQLLGVRPVRVGLVIHGVGPPLRLRSLVSCAPPMILCLRSFHAWGRC